MRRRFKKIDVKFVSLCPKGATRLAVAYKEDAGIPGAEFHAATKALDGFDDKGELLAVVYAPEIVDAQGDVASAEAVKEMCHSFIPNGGTIDTRHNFTGIPKDKVRVVENFIIQKGDNRFADWKNLDGKPVDVTGGWGLLMKIDDPGIRKLYREGAWNGVSLWGPAEFEPMVAKETIADALAQRLAEKSGEIQMTADELKKMLDDRDSALVSKMMDMMKGVMPMAGKELPPKGDAAGAAGAIDATSKKITFDPTNPAAVKKHLADLERVTLEKSVDWNNPEAVRKHLESLPPATTPAAEPEEVVALKAEIEEKNAKILKLRSASTAVGVAPAQKSDESDPFALGREMGQMANSLRGIVTKK